MKQKPNKSLPAPKSITKNILHFKIVKGNDLISQQDKFKDYFDKLLQTHQKINNSTEIDVLISENPNCKVTQDSSNLYVLSIIELTDDYIFAKIGKRESTAQAAQRSKLTSTNKLVKEKIKNQISQCFNTTYIYIDLHSGKGCSVLYSHLYATPATILNYILKSNNIGFEGYVYEIKSYKTEIKNIKKDFKSISKGKIILKKEKSKNILGSINSCNPFEKVTIDFKLGDKQTISRSDAIEFIDNLNNNKNEFDEVNFTYINDFDVECFVNLKNNLIKHKTSCTFNETELEDLQIIKKKLAHIN